LYYKHRGRQVKTNSRPDKKSLPVAAASGKIKNSDNSLPHHPPTNRTQDIRPFMALATWCGTHTSHARHGLRRWLNRRQEIQQRGVVGFMTIQYFNNLRDLNRFLKTTPVDLPSSRLNEIKTRAKKKKASSFMVWVNPSGHVIDLSMRV